MNIFKYCLFKTLDGTAVGAIGATLVNAAAYFIGFESVDIVKMAEIMAVGSVLLGLARGEAKESTFANTEKHDFSKDVIGFSVSRLFPRTEKFAASTIINILENMGSAATGFTAYAALALLDVTSPSFYTCAKLILGTIAASTVETAYQPHVFQWERREGHSFVCYK